MNIRRFSGLLLVSMLALTAGFTIIVFFLLSTASQRTPQFWITLGVAIFCEIITFGFAFFFNATGGESQHPVPSLFGIGSAIAFYDLGAMLISGVFWLAYSISLKWYVILHMGALTGIVLLVCMASIFLHSSKANEASDLNSSGFIAELQRRVSDANHELDVSPEATSLSHLKALLLELTDAVRFCAQDSKSHFSAWETDIRHLVVSICEDVKQLSVSTENPQLIERKVLACIYKIKQRNVLLKQGK